MATTALHGWHPGEIEVQKRLGYDEAVSYLWRVTESAMREQHRIFHTSNLPFIPVTTLDDDQRPWASIVAGSTGEINFVKSPDHNTLVVNARLWPGEPLLHTAKAWQDSDARQKAFPERFLTAGIGLEFSTRRRNKFAGEIAAAKPITDLDWQFRVNVTEALGNCPKYITVRDLVPYPSTSPKVVFEQLHMDSNDRIPDDAINFIHNCDTVFVGSVYKSDPSTAARYPSHAGMNFRGGPPGFVRVDPDDGRTVVLPDYSGNRFMMSLGNIQSSGLVALTFVCFTTGDILYLTGTAAILVGPAALEVMPRQACVITMKTTGCVFVRDALPVRPRPGAEVIRSPYNPKVKYLANESQSVADAGGSHRARLASGTQLSQDLAVFRFEVAAKPGVALLKIRPGQAVALDFMDWIGPPVYRHMANEAPESINDDRVRTWTVSSAHEGKDVTWFEMAMREMPGGAVTGALFKLLRRHPDNKLGKPVQFGGNVIADVVGVTGDFFLPEEPVNALWVAGGIGLTPFISMLTALEQRGKDAKGDIVLALSARDPDPLLVLTLLSLSKMAPGVKIRIDLFTRQEDVKIKKFLDNIEVNIHKGRIPAKYWAEVSGERDVLICGPGPFGDVAVDGLRAAGVPNSKIAREGFY